MLLLVPLALHARARTVCAQAGVNAEAISHEDYLNAPGESFSVKLEKAGSYAYYCDPHKGAGMKGSITVQ